MDTSFLGAYHTPPTALRNHPPLCCATCLELDFIAFASWSLGDWEFRRFSPPNLQVSKSPDSESNSKKTLRTSRTRMLVLPYGFGFAESTLRFASLIFGASCVSLNRCQVRRPRGDRPTNSILPLSKLQLNPNPVNLVNPVKKTTRRHSTLLHLYMAKNNNNSSFHSPTPTRNSNSPFHHLQYIVK